MGFDPRDGLVMMPAEHIINPRQIDYFEISDYFKLTS